MATVNFPFEAVDVSRAYNRGVQCQNIFWKSLYRVKGIERDIGRERDRGIIYARVVELRSEFRIRRDGSEQLRKSKFWD